MNLNYRLAIENDIIELNKIANDSREYMKEYGNIMQWNNGYPGGNEFAKDIKNEFAYIIEYNNEIVGYAALMNGEDPMYQYIEGEWKYNIPYISIHRVMINKKYRGKGLGIKLFNIFFNIIYSKGYRNIRIDTHKLNAPMLNIIKKMNFEYTGIVYAPDNSERVAFERLYNEK